MEVVSTQSIGDDGFTLLEVMLAATIFSIGLLALSAISISVVNGNYRSRQLTTATTLAQSKMEALRNLGYANVPDSEIEDPIIGYAGFRRTVDIDPPLEASDATVPANTKRVTINVQWDASDGSTPSVSISSYISR